MINSLLVDAQSCSPVPSAIVAVGTTTNCCRYYVAQPGDTAGVALSLGLNPATFLTLNPELATNLGPAQGLVSGRAYVVSFPIVATEVSLTC